MMKLQPSSVWVSSSGRIRGLGLQGLGFDTQSFGSSLAATIAGFFVRFAAEHLTHLGFWPACRLRTGPSLRPVRDPTWKKVGLVNTEALRK